MSEILVTGPDGSKIKFPAGTSEADIVGALSAHYGSQERAPATIETPMFDAMGNATGAVERVAPMAPAAPTRQAQPNDPGMLESFWRGGVQGATLGGGDEFMAAGAGARAAMQGESFAPAYEKQLAETQANNRLAREANPWTYMGGQAVGIIPGLFAGAQTQIGRGLLGLLGKTLLSRTGWSTGGGALLGATQGYLGTDGGNTARLNGLGEGALWGGGFGLAGPTVAAGAGAAMRHAVDSFKPTYFMPGAGKLPGDVMQLVGDDVARAGGAPAVSQRLQELGPETMLMDVAPSFQGSAKGLAVLPETRDAIRNPVKARHAGQSDRLLKEVETTLGPDPQPPLIKAGIEAGLDDVGKQYPAALRGASEFDPAPLLKMVDDIKASPDGKGSIGSYLNRVEDLLAPVRQTSEGRVRVPDTSPQGLHVTRRELDKMVKEIEAAPGGTGSVAWAHVNAIRNAVDDQMRAIAPPVKEVDATFAHLSRQKEALDEGARILDGDRTAPRPIEVRERFISAGAPPEGMIGPSAEALRLRQGLVGDVYRKIGNRENDLEALRSIMKGGNDWPREKMATAIGPERTQALARALERDKTFRDTFQKIDANAETADRVVSAAAQKPGAGEGFIDPAMVVGAAAGGPGGAAIAGGMRTLKAANDSVRTASDVARNQLYARILAEADPNVIIPLLEVVERRAAAGPRAIAAGDQAQRLAQIMMASEGDNARRAAIRAGAWR